MNPSELQFSGTRDEKGEIKISAVPAMNPKEHQYIKFDKESPSHRALLSASADKEHPNYVEGLAIHSGGMFSVPKAATRKPHEKAPMKSHLQHRLISDAMGPSKKSTASSPVKAVATALNVDQVRSAKRKDTPEAIAARNAQIKKARGK